MQIDILMLTPSGIVILEIKNIRGEVHLKRNPHQMIRKTETGETDIYTNPELQLEQYILAMQSFLDAKKIAIPIYGAIIFPFNNANIHREGEGLPILMGKELPLYVHKITVKNQNLDMDKIKQTISAHLRHIKPFPLCQYFKIESAALKKGVSCEKCGQFGMQKLKKAWYCQNCNHLCRKAHVRALQDYYMLLGETMTNQECRQFLQITSTDVAKRILQNSNVVRSGSGKYTKYNLSGLYFNR